LKNIVYLDENISLPYFCQARFKVTLYEILVRYTLGRIRIKLPGGIYSEDKPKINLDTVQE